MSLVATGASAAAEKKAEKNAEDTRIIKVSCAYRAKFNEGDEVYICPLEIVPHPMNRGGDKVKTLRCRSITASIAEHGFDVIEAEQNAVMIESPPNAKARAEIKQAGIDPDFDAYFAAGALCEEDMCLQAGGLELKGGSVSHSHLNCTPRNVQTGKKGCECKRTPAVAGGGEG